MFQCQICQKQQAPRTPCKKIVVETRQHRHPFRDGEPPQAPKGMPRKPSPIGEHWEWDDKKKKWKWTWYHDFGGTGPQIVRELQVCPACATEMEQRCQSFSKVSPAAIMSASAGT